MKETDDVLFQTTGFARVSDGTVFVLNECLQEWQRKRRFVDFKIDDGIDDDRGLRGRRSRVDSSRIWRWSGGLLANGRIVDDRWGRVRRGKIALFAFTGSRGSLLCTWAFASFRLLKIKRISWKIKREIKNTNSEDFTTFGRRRYIGGFFFVLLIAIFFVFIIYDSRFPSNRTLRFGARTFSARRFGFRWRMGSRRTRRFGAFRRSDSSRSGRRNRIGVEEIVILKGIWVSVNEEWNGVH